MRREVSGTYDEVIARLPELLKEEGFGVLTRIDVKATLKEKLGVDFRRYQILGACNPKLAHEALTYEVGLGVMLPCNVAVWEDDAGTVINPLTLKGQIHGGVAQGVGQALMEQVIYDRESGQLLTASFMEYGIPRADDFPDMHIESNPVPTKLNPLGAKGAGEAGTVGALPAVMNAVMDALAPLGVRELDMPATSERVWNAIQAARAGR